MAGKQKNRPHGHYCKICGQYKANEKFSGKGHANHICRACAKLPAAAKAESQTINRLMNFPMRRLSDSEKKWLENRVHDQRAEVAALAREVYHLHFPYAERNAMKKQLTINRLFFALHTEICDEYGDMEMVDCSFTVDRKNRTIAMKRPDTGGTKEVVILDGKKMSRLLRWIVHTLEIFMWPQDYALSPVGLDPSSDMPPEYRPGDGLTDDFYGENEFDMAAFIRENTQLEKPVPEGNPFWRVQVEYTNHTAQDIPCYNEYFPDRAEELYFALLEYFAGDV